MLRLISQGKLDTEIARNVGLTGGSVRVILSRLYRRLGVRNRAHAAAWFVRRSLTERRKA